MQIPKTRSNAALNLLYWITRPTGFIDQNMAELGPTFQFDVAGWGRVVMSGDPDLMREAAALEERDLSAEGGNALMRSILGDTSLFIVEGAAHDHARRLNKISLASIDDDAFRAGFRARLTEAFPGPVPGGGQSVHLLAACRSLAFGSVLEILFGNQRLAGTAFQARLNDAMGTLSTVYAFIEPLRSVGIGPLRLSRIADARIERINRFVYQELDAHLRERPETPCFLKSLLASMTFENTPAQRSFVRDQLMSAMLAGYDTTAASMQWMVEQALGQPQTLDRLRGHLDAAANSAERTRWQDAYIAEVQRTRPAVESFSRLTRGDLRIGGYDVPRDALFTYSIYMVHRNPQVYDGPESFCIDRFMRGKPAYPAFIPFGMGARYCIGAKYAMLQLRELLAHLLAQSEGGYAIKAQSVPSRRNVILAPSASTRAYSR